MSDDENKEQENPSKKGTSTEANKDLESQKERKNSKNEDADKSQDKSNKTTSKDVKTEQNSLNQSDSKKNQTTKSSQRGESTDETEQNSLNQSDSKKKQPTKTSKRGELTDETEQGSDTKTGAGGNKNSKDNTTMNESMEKATRVYSKHKNSKESVSNSRKDSNPKKTKKQISTSSDKEIEKEGSEAREKEVEEDNTDNSVHATISTCKNFEAEQSCKTLHDAMDGLGTNESAIIQVLTSCNNKQRQQLKEVYERKYKVNLIDELKGELSGDLETAVLGLLMEPVDFSAKCLYKSMSGIGTDERLLTYVIVSSSPEEMKTLQTKYKEVYKKDLSNEVRVETSGVLQKILLSMIADSDRSQSSSSLLNDEDVEQQAMKLYNNGQVAFKYDVDQCADILTTASRNKVRRICEKYAEMSGEDVLDSIAKYTAGDSEIALLALGNYIVRMLRDPIKYISSALHDAVNGVGTNETLLTYVIISRSEIDLLDVMKRYQEEYKKPLAQTIKSECSGDFRNILLAVLNPKAKPS